VCRRDVIDIFRRSRKREALRVELFDEAIESLTVVDPLPGHQS